MAGMVIGFAEKNRSTPSENELADLSKQTSTAVAARHLRDAPVAMLYEVLHKNDNYEMDH
jgi:hypothetical protein